MCRFLLLFSMVSLCVHASSNNVTTFQIYGLLTCQMQVSTKLWIFFCAYGSAAAVVKLYCRWQLAYQEQNPYFKQPHRYFTRAYPNWINKENISYLIHETPLNFLIPLACLFMHWIGKKLCESFFNFGTFFKILFCDFLLCIWIIHIHSKLLHASWTITMQCKTWWKVIQSLMMFRFELFLKV